jgi:hypothetical protein
MALQLFLLDEFGLRAENDKFGHYFTGQNKTGTCQLFFNQKAPPGSTRWVLFLAGFSTKKTKNQPATGQNKTGTCFSIKKPRQEGSTRWVLCGTKYRV